MKKENLWMLAALMATTFTFSACSTENEPTTPTTSGNGLTINATIGGGNSRASLSDHSNVWSTGDKISVHIGATTNPSNDLTLVSGEGTQNGIFSNNTVEYTTGDYLTCIYPNNASQLSPGSITYYVPSTQTVTLGSNTYDKDACFLAAYGNDPDYMYFYNLCTLLKVQLPTGNKYKSVMFKTHNADANHLAGTVLATMTDGSAPAQTHQGTNISRSVTVNCPGTPTEQTDVYGVVNPGTYSGGLTVYVTTENEVTETGGSTYTDYTTYYKVSDGTVKLNRSGLASCGLFDPTWPCGLEPCTDTFCSESTYQFVDLGTGDGVLWGNMNIGATNTDDDTEAHSVGSAYSNFTLGTNPILGAYGDYFKHVEFTADASKTTGKYPTLYTPNGTSPTVTAGITYDPGTLILNPLYDIATVTGKNLSTAVDMRMPTDEEFQNLIDKCYWVYCDGVEPTREAEVANVHHRQHKGNVAGWIVFKVKEGATVGKAGEMTINTRGMDGEYTLEDPHIFLPAAGSFSMNDANLKQAGANESHAYYWSSHRNSSATATDNHADYLEVANGASTYKPKVNTTLDFTYRGKTVRPVQGARKSSSYETFLTGSETLGKTDFTTGYFGAHSDAYSLTKGQTKYFTFVNHTNGGENWYNWLLCCTNSSTFPGWEGDTSLNNYFFILRADNYEDKTDKNDSRFVTSDFNWSTFQSDMNGATVYMTVTYTTEGKVTVNCKIATSNNKVYNYNYTCSQTLSDETVYLYFTVHNNCYLSAAE